MAKQGEYVTDDFPTLLKFLKSDLLLNRPMATRNLFVLFKERKKQNKTKQKRQTCLAQFNVWKIRDGGTYFFTGWTRKLEPDAPVCREGARG